MAGFWDWMAGTTPGGAVGEVGQKVVTGIFDGVRELIDEFHVSAEEKAEMRLKVAEHKLKAIEAIMNDVQNARAMQIQTRSIWPGIMSFMAGAGFFGGFVTVMAHGLPENLDEFTKSIIFTFVGAMVASWTTALNFWMGSTMGSQNKDTLLHQSTPTPKP